MDRNIILAASKLNMTPWSESRREFCNKHNLSVDDYDISLSNPDSGSLAKICYGEVVAERDVSSLMTLSALVKTKPILIITPGTKKVADLVMDSDDIQVFVVYEDNVIEYVDYCLRIFGKIARNYSNKSIQDWFVSLGDSC